MVRRRMIWTLIEGQLLGGYESEESESESQGRLPAKPGLEVPIYFAFLQLGFYSQVLDLDEDGGGYQQRV